MLPPEDVEATLTAGPLATDSATAAALLRPGRCDRHADGQLPRGSLAGLVNDAGEGSLIGAPQCGWCPDTTTCESRGIATGRSRHCFVTFADFLGPSRRIQFWRRLACPLPR